MYDGGGSEGSADGQTIWDQLNEKWYSFCDAVEDKGAKIYEYFVNPLEERNIPSLPVAVILLLLLLLSLGWLLFGSSLGGGAGQAYSLSVSVTGERGAVNDALVTLSQDDSDLSSLKTEDGVALFDDLAQGEYEIAVSKDGFENGSKRVSIPDEKYVEISLRPLSGAGPIRPPGFGAGNGSGGNGGQLNFSRWPDDWNSTRGVILNLFVSDTLNSTVPSAIATIYDRESGTRLQTVDVENGWAAVEDLDVGMVVYADVAADGYAPYDGHSNAVTITVEGPNLLNVVLTPLNGPGGANASGEWQTTVLSVVDQNNTPVQAAQVQVFKIGSTTPVAIPDSFTNSSGRLAIVLNASGNPFYQILVSKLGYVSNSSGFFHAGAAVNVLLYSLGGGDGGNGTCTGSNCQSCVGSDCSCSNGQCICTGPNCSICTGADCSCSTGTCTCTGPDCNTCTGPDCIVPPHCPGSADCPPIFENLSTLIIFVSSDSQPVPDASIVVWRPQDNIRLDGDTGSNGAAQFLFIPRNASVVVNASKNNFFATGSIVMNAPVVQLNLSLSRARGTVIARALNFANGQPIATAQFSAFPEGTSVLESSCAVQEPFDSCSLRAGLGLHYDIGVMAPGFIGESQSIVMDGQVVEVTFYLVRESDVGISQIKDFKVSLQGSNDPAGVLYPGRTYEATFTLLGNTSSASDSFGFYFDVESSRAVIKSVTPPGPAAKSLGSQSQSCTPQQVNYANASAAWVDFSYAGGTHPTGKAVKIVFEIKPLPQGVDEDNFTVHYRSYLVQGGMYYRNPFSRELGFNAASPLASGCGAPSFDRQYAINGLGTTCSDFACIRVMFNQIGATGVRDNFTARFVSGAQQDLVSYGPMLMSYEIMLKPNVATLPDSGELMLSFNAPGNYLGVSTVSYPDQPDSQGTPPNPADTTVSMFGSEGLLNSVSISLDHLRRYSNMDAGFTFGGEFALIPLNPVQGGQLTLDVSAGNQSSTHTSTYNVEQSSVRADDFTVVAFNDVKQYPNVHNADPFAASSTANCTAENTLPTFGRNGFANQCHHGYVEASFSILVRSNLSNARLVFNTPSDLPSSLIYQPPSLKKDGVPVPLVQPAFSQTGFSVDLGFIRAGSRVEGTEFLIPSTDGNYNLSVGVSYSGLDNGVVKQVVVGSANGSSPGCFPPNSPECLGTPVPDGNISLIGSIPRDSCGSYVVVKFDPVQRQKVLLQTQSQDKDCGSIQMRATPLFPADALPVSVSTSNPILVTADQDDGSSPCFESCRVNAQGQVEESSCSRGFNAFTQNGNNVLRYNPESYSQCQQFQSVGNHLKPAKIRIKLSPSTLTSVPAYLNITVSTLDAFDSPSLFIGPIYTPVLSFAKPDPTYPQLWAVTNLNQLGHRTIDVYLASPSSPDQPIQRYPPFQFDGPGTQVFGVSRNPSNLVVVAKEKGVTVLVENAVGTYNVSGLSEYADFVTTAIQAVGSPTGNQANVLARSNVGFMPDVVKPILEKIKLRAEQSAFWRTSGSAVCQESAACVENGYQPFSDCCRAKAEDWAKTTI
ncbi:TPA: hypothetical protein HA244_06985, partial [Candidatus Micrarchaeota archaeon]|nr:hypothetical protein [Candidatus Micrarchaeota archaeon]